MNNERLELLDFALSSPHSNFYAERFKSAGLETVAFVLDDWGHIPLLTRDDISSTPFWKRIFVDEHDVLTIRSSSGTSGKSVILTPRAGVRNIMERFLRLNVKISGYLAFVNPAHLIADEMHMSNCDVPVIAGDLSEPDRSVLQCKNVPVNVIKIYMYSLERIKAALDALNMSNRIQAIELFGEKPSKPFIRSVQRDFPNAALIVTYGLSEALGDCAHCSLFPMGTFQELWYEPLPGYFFELLTDEGVTSTPKSGQEGELILTTMAPYIRAFPLIRYKTGDTVVVGEQYNEGSFQFRTLFRSADDRLKVASGIIWRDEVERVLEKEFKDLFDGSYEFALSGAKKEGVLEEGSIFLPEALLSSIPDRAACADRIAHALRVSPKRSYADGVDDGLYGVLQLMPLPTMSHVGKKRHLYRNDE